MKKFKESDIFHNVIKTYPKIRIFCYNGKIYYNTTSGEGVKLNNFLNNSQQEETPPPAFDLEDSFEGWPGTYEFSSGVLSSPNLEDSFESAEGWG